MLKVQVVHEAIHLGSSDSAIDRAIGFCGLAKTASCRVAGGSRPSAVGGVGSA